MGRRSLKITLVSLLGIFLFQCATPPPPDIDNEVNVDDKEKEAIKQVVINSQDYEMELYIHPNEFKESDLTRYWLPSVPSPEVRTDWSEIERGILRLKKNEWHYAEEIKDPQTSEVKQRKAGKEFLDILSVKVYNSGFGAEVITNEKWFIPTHDKNHQLIKGKLLYLGPYKNRFLLVKTNNQWLVVNSNTPRARERSIFSPTRVRFITPIAIALCVLLVPLVYFIKRRGRRAKAPTN